MSDDEQPKNISQRVTVLEVGLSSLSDTVKDLAHVVKSESHEVNKHISRLSDKFTDAQTPNWGNWIAFAAVLIILLGAITTPIWLSFAHTEQDIIRNEQNIKYLLDSHMKDVYNNGKQDARLKNLEKNARHKNSL